LDFLGCLAEEKKNIKILLFSLKTLTYFEDCSGSRIKISVLASFPAID
jgi:hypothetical protein